MIDVKVEIVNKPRKASLARSMVTAKKKSPEIKFDEDGLAWIGGTRIDEWLRAEIWDALHDIETRLDNVLGDVRGKMADKKIMDKMTSVIELIERAKDNLL